MDYPAGERKVAADAATDRLWKGEDPMVLGSLGAGLETAAMYLAAVFSTVMFQHHAGVFGTQSH